MFACMRLLRRVGCVCVVLAAVGCFIYLNGRIESWHSQITVARSDLVATRLATPAAVVTEAGCVRKQPRANPDEISEGFMLALRFWEQQTQATKTILQLQCFASSYGMQTVEPFLYGSFLGFPFQDMRSNQSYLRMGELVDMDVWNRESVEKFGFPPVAKWSEFLRTAPRSVVTVCVKYRNPPRIPIPVPGSNFRIGCVPECFRKLNASLDVLKRYGDFRIVKEACANFVVYAGSVSRKDFIHNILGDRGNRNVTVLLNEFRGFFGLFRMPVLSNCGVDHHKPNITIIPGPRIRTDAAKYIANVLHNKPYIAVLVRIERVVLHLNYSIAQCSQKLEKLINTLSQQYAVKNYFLAMDIGKFGSRGTRLHNLTSHGDIVLSAVYGSTLSFSQWERMFERYASELEGAYVANLQRAIAARARCLVLFGGGGFQAQAKHFYQAHHADPKQWCVHRVCADHEPNLH